jgi:hypothetical protein
LAAIAIREQESVAEIVGQACRRLFQLQREGAGVLQVDAGEFVDIFSSTAGDHRKRGIAGRQSAKRQAAILQVERASFSLPVKILLVQSGEDGEAAAQRLGCRSAQPLRERGKEISAALM